ncbi:hypothetical protein CSC14_1731 [Proteus mirabilis]|nr:hypothetical protein CSC14_1731 [Proteus mirabilis]
MACLACGSFFQGKSSSPSLFIPHVKSIFSMNKFNGFMMN